jgi:DNA-binding MarR family transcriptional regulator
VDVTGGSIPISTDTLNSEPARIKKAKNGRGKRTAAAHLRGSEKIDLGQLPGLIGYTVRLAQIAIFRDYQQSFSSFDIRPIEYGILTVIDANPGLNQMEVCTALGIKRGNFVPLLDGLERRKLATRRKAEDQRANALYLTKKGKLLIKKLQEINSAHERKVSSSISGEERNQLIRLLNRIREAADKRP